MDQEELNALVESKVFQWDREELLSLQRNRESREDKFVSKACESQQILTILNRIQNSMTGMQRDLEEIAAVSSKIQRDVQEMLNFNIRQLEVFEKLVHRFPSIKVFQNSFEETQDIIEKNIRIQESSTLLYEKGKKVTEENKNQSVLHQKSSEIIQLILQINRYIQSISEGKIDLSEIDTSGLQREIEKGLKEQGYKK